MGSPKIQLDLVTLRNTPRMRWKKKKKSHLKLVDEDTSWLGDNINGQFWEDKGTPAPNEGSIVSWAGLTQSFRRIL